MMRDVSCDAPRTWPSSYCSKPITLAPLTAAWYAAPLPRAPRPTTATSNRSMMAWLEFEKRSEKKVSVELLVVQNEE